MNQDQFRFYQFKENELIVYDFDDFDEKKVGEKDCLWIELYGFKQVNKVLNCDLFKNVHPLLKEDLQELNPRAKMQIFDYFLSIVLKLLSVKNQHITVSQLNLIVSEKVLLTVFEEPYKGLDDLKIRLQDKPIKHMDTLLYDLLDAVVDDYNCVFDEWSTFIDETEQALLGHSTEDHMQILQSYKKELFLIYRSISPMRDVLSRITHKEIEFMTDVNVLYHSEVQDHLIQVLDELELYRETVNTMVEVYLSSLSNRTNEIMKVLTVISTVFIPLTFITGLYGMNFLYMPEYSKPYAYPLVWLVMILISASLLFYFKKKKWF